MLAVEALIRRDLSLRLKEAFNMVGLAFIVLLMVTVIFFDVRRGYFSKHPPAAAAAAATPTPLPGVTPLPAASPAQ